MRIAELPMPGQYARAWRRLIDLQKTAPQTLVRHPSRGFPAVPADELLQEFRRALHRRINDRGGDLEANVDMDIDLVRDARDLDAILRQRVRVYQFRTSMMRSRFGHLLARYDD